MPVADVNSWFEAAPENHRLILLGLRKIVLASGSDVVEEFKWGRPVYSSVNGMFCYLHFTKSYVTLGFHHGTKLKDPKSLLQGDGKDMRHIKLKTAAEARNAAVKLLIKQAAKLT